MKDAVIRFRAAEEALLNDRSYDRDEAVHWDLDT
jgi:hypothetical protein